MALIDKTFSEVIAFTRPASAPYVNSSGQTVTADADVPRLTHTTSGQPLGLLLESERQERAVIRNGNWRTPNRGTWVCRGDFDSSIILSGLGFYVEADGEGTIVITYSLSGSKVFSQGRLQYESAMRPTEEFNILDEERAVIARMEFIPAMLGDNEAAAMATGGVDVRLPLTGLWAGGHKGFLWSSLPYYQDPVGATVATWGNPVGLIEDDTDNGVEFTQATVTARPILGRVPVGGRRNFLTWTEDFSQTAWTNNNVTVVPAPAPDGTMSAARLVVNSGTTGAEITRVYQTGTPIPSGGRRYQLVAKAAGCRYVTFGRFGNSFNYALAQFDLISGSVVSYRVSGIAYSETTPPTITDIGGGWYACDMGFSAADENVPIQLGVVPSNTERDTPTLDNSQYEIGNGVDGVLIWHPQVELGDDATPYQRVGATAYDVTESGVPDVFYLQFDGTDDSVSTTLPAITNGTVVIAGTNGIWIDDQYNHAGGTLTIGTDTYTNGPSGILDVVGDLLVGGCFVIDRQLTAEERQRVATKLKSMGAPGVFELGPELMTLETLTSPSSVSAGLSYSYNQTLGEATLETTAPSSYPSARFNVLPADGYILYSGTVDASNSTVRGFFAQGGAVPSNRISAQPGDVVTSSRIEPTISVAAAMTVDGGSIPIGAVIKYRDLSARKLELIS